MRVDLNLRQGVRRLLQVLLLLAMTAGLTFAEERHAARGLVLKIDAPHHSIVVSCDAIPGYMEAMTMPLTVGEHENISTLTAGTVIDFILAADKNSASAHSIRVHNYEGLEPDPLSARRLSLLNRLTNSYPKSLAIGDAVPDFTLTGQDGVPVTFSRFHGKVVVLNFIYTRCTLPNFCLRSSNNLGNLQRRFRNQLGKKLVLVTVTFDPAHDSPEALAQYAKIWKADQAWHFLTGSASDIQRVCALFGVDFFPEEGLMDHTLHTALVDRHGRLVANLEGNEFTAKQLGDLVSTVLDEESTIKSPPR